MPVPSRAGKADNAPVGGTSPGVYYSRVPAAAVLAVDNVLALQRDSCQPVPEPEVSSNFEDYRP